MIGKGLENQHLPMARTPQNRQKLYTVNILIKHIVCAYRFDRNFQTSLTQSRYHPHDTLRSDGLHFMAIREISDTKLLAHRGFSFGYAEFG